MSKPLATFQPDQRVTFQYTNWRGETAIRTVIPIRLMFGTTEWHPEPQWLLEALDPEKDADRLFALKDIKLLSG